MSYLVLARKWRPKDFDDLTGQEPIARILKNALSQNRIAHAYLFSGPRGVGKTSTARILAKALNCKDGPTPIPCGMCDSCIAITEGSSIDVIEIDGASNNSVDDIRDLREKVKYAPSRGRYKVYIIDEVHMLSTSAFNALLKTLEEPPAHVIFVLATTEIKKIPATVLSRCQHMPFRRIKSGAIKARLMAITESEGIKISPSALSLIARAADGSMRDSLTILDQLSAFSGDITEEDARDLLGIADISMLADLAMAILKGDRSRILSLINTLSETGTDFRAFSRELINFFRELLIASVMKNPESVLDLSDEEMASVKKIVAESSEDQINLILSDLIKADTDLRISSSPQLSFEISMIRASFLSSVKPIKDVIQNINRLALHLREKLPVYTDGEVKNNKGTCITSDNINVSTSDDEMIDDSDSEISDNVRPEMQATEELSSDNDIAVHWKKTLSKIDPPLASKLSQVIYEFTDNEMILTLNGGLSLFEDSIKKELKNIEKILSEESGRKIKIKLTSKHAKPIRKKDLESKIVNEPLIKEALELFEGRIVDVSPLETIEKENYGGEDV